MDITGLNFDCLIKVHGYFDLQCLFNVGVTNGWLGTAAQYIYKQKFGALKVELDPSEERAAPLIVGDTIRVGGLKMCLQFLRCFGPCYLVLLFVIYTFKKGKLAFVSPKTRVGILI